MSRIDNPSQTGGESASRTGQLREKAAGIGQSLREAGSQAKEAAAEQLGQLKETASQYYQQGRDKAAEYYQQGRDKAMEMEHDLEDYVRSQPLKSVLIAAGVGLLLGILWRRR
jgi:ElaB/YqjD/DUF883 family membrane-anchored ribosome-binding protein